MRIVTLNTWKCEGDYPRRLVRIAEQLAALAPDVVCLQECFAAEEADTARTLAEATGLRALVTPNRQKPRVFHGRWVSSSSGLAMLVNAEQVHLSVLPLPHESGDPDRLAQIVRLSTRWGGCMVANVHLTHLADADTSRRRQLTAVLASVDEARNGTPALICGDFNAAPASTALDPLRLHGGVDWGVADPTGLPGTLLGNPDAGAVDHVVLLDGAASGWHLQARRRVLDRPGRDGLLPSDHSGVMVELVAPDAARGGNTGSK